VHQQASNYHIPRNEKETATTVDNHTGISNVQLESQ